LAYSTVSQLGYMFLACGVASYFAGIFHLMTHAFFKALLFMGAGSVIHGMSGDQEMPNMGGLKKYMPHTWWTFMLAYLAIAGIPPFAGFFSKDEILWKAFTHQSEVAVLGAWWGKLLWAVGAAAALMPNVKIGAPNDWMDFWVSASSFVVSMLRRPSSAMRSAIVNRYSPGILESINAVP